MKRSRQLGEGEEARKQRKCAGQLAKAAEKLALYEQQEQILGGRNSYSKTDPDATFMRMKDGELRAGYNVQLGSQDGFITGCSVHAQANDGATLLEHLEEREAQGLPATERVVGDAGYGSEENYAALEKAQLEAYLKYRDFRRDVKDHHGPYHASRFKYDEEQNEFICPAGERLSFHRSEERRSQRGFLSQVQVYKGASCGGCAFRGVGVKGSGHRLLCHNRRLQAYQQKARARLCSPEGEALSRRRGNVSEGLFGDWKHNQGVRR
jgi:hypothetical protein